ncbi:MAG: dienelactone hydrolase family protein [Acidimicrobiales bacterium]|nr:dienelactone hydrolase family protein [Acidimicrobiales bacterium]
MKPPKALLLTPGAGADRNQSALVALDDALSAKKIVVERMDFPYRIAGRRAPDRPAVLLESVRQGAAALTQKAKTRPASVALGGRSMGGRICSMAVADGLPAAALVLISYPLHPPGKPDKLRVEHFPSINVPCLFVSGTRDTFGNPDELTKATQAIVGPVTHVWIEGGDHGLRRKDDEAIDAVRSWLL